MATLFVCYFALTVEAVVLEGTLINITVVHLTLAFTGGFTIFKLRINHITISERHLAFTGLLTTSKLTLVLSNVTF